MRGRGSFDFVEGRKAAPSLLIEYLRTNHTYIFKN